MCVQRVSNGLHCWVCWGGTWSKFLDVLSTFFEKVGFQIWGLSLAKLLGSKPFLLKSTPPLLQTIKRKNISRCGGLFVCFFPTQPPSHSKGTQRETETERCQKKKMGLFVSTLISNSIQICFQLSPL